MTLARPLIALSLVGLAACGRTAPAVDPLTLVPADTRLLAAIDVARVRTSPLHARLLALRDRSDYLRWRWEDLARSAGVDLARDLDHVVLAAPVEATRPDDLGVLLVGRFDERRVIDWYKGRIRKDLGEPRESSYGGRVVVHDQEERELLAFVSPRVLVGGSKRWVHGVLDVAAGKGPAVRTRPEMNGLLLRVPAAALAWAVVSLPPAAAGADGLATKVSGGVAAVDGGSGVRATVQLDTAGAPVATELAELLTRGLTQLRQSPLAGRLGVGTLLEQTAVATESNTCHLRVALTLEQLDATVRAVERGLRELQRSPLVPAGRGGAADQAALLELLKGPGGAGGRDGRPAPASAEAPPAPGAPARSAGAPAR
ncbi:MAG TPA: hypothetical protein VGQ83_35605 [Polyangia bacterium]|jgi:hypothetical protein